MRRTPVRRLLVVAALSLAVSSAGLRLAEGQGATLLPVPALASAVVLLIAALVLGLGWTVRQYTKGKRPSLDPLLAARTVVLATASTYTGALLTGWYGGQVVVVLRDLIYPARRAVAVAGGAALLCAVILVVAGLVVERWCEVRPRDPDDPGGGAPSAAPGPVA
ncbi:MAG TPA: DUF3180 domain-containing protein [Actinotalea sp.]|jgi:hypothetical protein